MLPSRYRKKIIIDKQRGCWLWQGEVTKRGYGRAWYKNHRYMAHRLVYWLLVKLHGDKFDIDNRKIELDHLCEVRNCVNPKHLEKVGRVKNCKRIHRRRKRIDENGKLIT